MPQPMEHHTESNPADIRITGLNNDKTRRENGSETVYQIYFELSGSPSQEWKRIFALQWASSSSLCAGENRPSATVERGFLSVHCLLSEVADPYLPALQKAVAGTNIAYAESLLRENVLQAEKEGAWKTERLAVDEMERSLKF